MEDYFDEKFKELKDEFLTPMKESLLNLKEQVVQNSKDIAENRALINNMKTNEHGNDPKILAREVALQIKLLHRVCITGCANEKQAKETLVKILGSENGIKWISEKKRRNQDDSKKEHGKIFIADLTAEKSKNCSKQNMSTSKRTRVLKQV